jgi:hypothetical protein
MNFILYPFMLLAAAGLALSVIAHVLAIAGIELPGGQLVWSLHMGIFVVWIPTVLVSMRATRHVSQKDYWKVAFSGCPVWMKRTLYGLFGYAIFNFILFMFLSNDGPRPTGDAPASVIRGFSGHWMIFYGAAFGTLYSVIHAPHLFRDRKCPSGHVVVPSANFCPECGHAFSKEPAAADDH